MSGLVSSFLSFIIILSLWSSQSFLFSVTMLGKTMRDREDSDERGDERGRKEKEVIE